MSHTEKTIDSTRIFEGKVVRLRRDTVELENGKQTFREVIDHPGGVSILAMDEEGKIFFVRAVPLSIWQNAAGTACWKAGAGRRSCPERTQRTAGGNRAAPQVGLNPWAV